MATRPHEVKESPIFVTKIDEDLGIVEAVVSVFGVLDDGNDIVHPGAYRKTITERGFRIRVLDQHNTDSILRVLGKPLELREIGRNELPAEVLERYPEATGGLFTRTQYLVDTPEGTGAFKRIKSGAVGEYSIGYEALDVDYSKVTRDGKTVTARNLRTIKLWEYSPVIWGMNPATVTAGVKGTDVSEDKTPTLDTKAQQPRHMGDVLVAGMANGVYWQLNDWLSRGLVTRDERSVMVTAVEAALDSVYNSLPNDVASRTLSTDNYFFWDALQPTMAGKAGRVLSGRNSQRVREALQLLTDLLAEADVDDAAEGSDDASNEKSQRLAGSETPPPTDLPLDDAQDDFDQQEEIRKAIADLSALGAKAAHLPTPT